MIENLRPHMTPQIERARRRRFFRNVEVDWETLEAMIDLANAAKTFYELHRGPQYVALKDQLDRLERASP